MLNVYTQIPDLTNVQRKYLVDILKPIFPKKRLAKYGLVEDYINLVASPKSSDYFILPFCWNYYLKTNSTRIAEKNILEAKKARKKILIWVTGDYYIPLPKYDNIISLYSSPYKSKQNMGTLALPVIIQDPLTFLGLDTINLQNYTEIPFIGFCGQSDPDLILSSIKMTKLVWQNIKYSLHLSKHYSGPTKPPTYLRKKILDILEKSTRIHSDFIRRKKYQGGISKEEDNFKNIKKEFYKNIVHTQYTLCIRGTGNFSARFYETLALGRIPVFVNTDCMLPFEDQINWGKHIVCIEQNKISEIETKVAEFHGNLNQDSLAHIQKMNRELWQNKFSFSGTL